MRHALIALLLLAPPALRAAAEDPAMPTPAGPEIPGPAPAETSADLSAVPATVPITLLPPPGPPPPAVAIPGPAGGEPPAVAPATLPPPAVKAPEPVARAPAAPSRALMEKLSAGDRAFLAGDYRPALFAYQDAAYLDPTSAVARIRLARAYSALGHGEQAQKQLRQALELDPGDAEARRLLQGLTAPASGAQQPPAQQATPPAAPEAPRVYKFTEEPAARP
jgi:tetratricopeptide (TPR) repeat protein